MANLSFRHVEIFWALMTTGSATGAAALLRTSQPTISRELGRLEHITGLQLFKRTNSKLVPTEQALMLFDEVKRAYFGLERIGKAADAIRQYKQGQIALVTLPAFSQAVLPRVCRHFLNLYPDVALTITPQDAPLLNEWISSQRFDLGLIEDSQAPGGTELEQIFGADMVCIVPTGHPLEAHAVIPAEAFQNEIFISLAANDPYRSHIDQYFENRGVIRRLLVETHSAAAICTTVAEGLGVAIINPLTALTYAKLGIQLRRVDLSIHYTLCAARPLYRPYSALVDSFVQSLRDCCGLLEQQLKEALQPMAASEETASR